MSAEVAMGNGAAGDATGSNIENQSTKNNFVVERDVRMSITISVKVALYVI
jgi:hypothetical protein